MNWEESPGFDWVWQNGFAETGTRDGFAEMFATAENVEKTLFAIEFLAQQYADDPAFAAISLVNEPIATHAPFGAVKKVRGNKITKRGRIM